MKGLHYFGITDIGKKRTNNEDSFICQALNTEDVIIACAIDGVGGYEGGEIAAAITNATILSRLKQPFANKKEVLVEALYLSNAAIAQEKLATQQNERMSCVVSLVLADISNNKFYFAHVGDTRLYLLRDKSLVKISKDQSFVGFLEDSGKLSEQEAMRHPKRNIINNALGFNNEIPTDDYIDSGESPFLPGDLLMLCTDGLSDLIDNAAMCNILLSEHTVPQKAESLVEAANNAGGKDNITVVLVQHYKLPAHTLHQIADIKPNASTIRIENASSANSMDKEKSVKTQKSTSNYSGIKNLFVLMLLLIVITLGWLYYTNQKNKRQHEKELLQLEVKTERNAREQLLLDSITATTSDEVFIINTTGSLPINFSDSIKIHTDTLHIVGNGAIITADPEFKGPAFIIDSSCKQIIFDSITFQNFDVAIVAYSKALQLRNVQFLHCNSPLQYRLSFKDSMTINGTLADSAFKMHKNDKL